MQLKSIDIYVFKLDNNGTFDSVGEINKYTSLIWPDKFNGFANFELNAPVTPENKFLIKKGNILWCGGDNACIIEIIQSDTDEDGQKTYKVKGRTLEMLLTTRIIWGTYNCKNLHISSAMYDIVTKQCINPNYPERKIPFLRCAEDDLLGKVTTFQKTGFEVYDTLEKLATEANLGFDVLFRPKEKALIFKVTQGVDRTVPGENLVIFSTDLEDILTSSYYTNNQDKKSLAFVAGENKGEGAERTVIITGNNASSGLERRELYVDARDLQSEVQNDDGSITTISDEDYRDMLNERGMEKLSENSVVETFEAKMRVTGDIRYIYGVDYYKGDKVIIQDTDLGIQVVATISEVNENFDDDYELVITFGYAYPTLIQKIKQKFT